MIVYGADFSGAKTPKGIYYAQGAYDNGNLTILKVVNCDDRLDLYAKIIASPHPWGLDFSFALPDQAYKTLGLNGWEELLGNITQLSRSKYAEILAANFTAYEGKCRDHNLHCRISESCTNAYSSFKKNNPNMQAMTYSALKLISYLKDFGCSIYPFTKLYTDKPRLYEVYPSHTWYKMNHKRSIALTGFIENFKECTGINIHCNSNIENQDAADAVVACATLCCAIVNYGLEHDWLQKPPFASNREWELRNREGVIVRLI